MKQVSKGNITISKLKTPSTEEVAHFINFDRKAIAALAEGAESPEDLVARALMKIIEKSKKVKETK